MLSRFKSHIHNFFSRILGMSYESPRIYFELQILGSPGVDVYCDHLLTHYREEEGGLARMKELRIAELRLMKEMDAVAQHEYLVAYIASPHGIAGCLSLERHPGDIAKDATQSDSALMSTSGRSTASSPLPHSSLSSQSSHDSSSKRCNAHDFIGVLDNPMRKRTDKSILQLNFSSGNPLYLYQLVLLAVMAHDSRMCYGLLSNNCYWFSRLMVDIVERKLGLEHILIDHPRTKFRLTKRTWRRSESGTLTGIALCTPTPGEDVVAIIAASDECTRSFENKVISTFQCLVIAESFLGYGEAEDDIRMAGCREEVERCRGAGEEVKGGCREEAERCRGEGEEVIGNHQGAWYTA